MKKTPFSVKRGEILVPNNPTSSKSQKSQIISKNLKNLKKSQKISENLKNLKNLKNQNVTDPERIRTSNLLIRSQTRYPLRHGTLLLKLVKCFVYKLQ